MQYNISGTWSVTVFRLVSRT